jgi:hypothetical protein
LYEVALAEVQFKSPTKPSYATCQLEELGPIGAVEGAPDSMIWLSAQSDETASGIRLTAPRKSLMSFCRYINAMEMAPADSPKTVTYIVSHELSMVWVKS